jgi:hypothetical protein
MAADDWEEVAAVVDGWLARVVEPAEALQAR